ncbi:MAG: hypothetical protein LBD38_03055 [Streptococcaceae bacterium]|jgi:hypothetical protein|nr:hypothetical protein [Streptococcaceae bacterium]
MKEVLIRILILIGFSIPTEVISVYLEDTYFFEIGFIISVFLTFILTFYVTYIKDTRLWVIGNLLTLAFSIVFEVSMNHGNLIGMTLKMLIFLICWIIPQVLGRFWGVVLRRT